MDCPECGTDVDADAASCPVCGGDLPGGGPDTAGEQGDETRPGEHGDETRPGEHGSERSPGGQSTNRSQGGQQDRHDGQAESGEREQPTQGPPGGHPDRGQPGRGQPNQGQPNRGQPAQGRPGHGQPGQTQSGQAGGPGGAGYGQQPQQSGQSLEPGVMVREFYDTYLSDLPFVPGLVAGLVVFLVGLGVNYGILVAITEALDGSSVVSFAPTASIQAGGLLLFAVQFASPVQFGALPGTVPATLGALYLLVPWLLLVVGTRFARYYASGGDIVDHVLTGATVVVGYLPAVAVGAILLTPGQLFPSAYGNAVFTAGLLYPVGIGGAGGLLQWFLDDYAGLVPKLTGFGASILVFLLLVGVAAGAGGSAVRSEPIALVVLSVLTFVGSQAFTFAGSGLWSIAYLVPPLVLFVVGYVRGRRGGAVEYLDGVRAGSSIAFGYGLLVFFALVPYAVVSDFGSEVADLVGETGATTLANAVAMSGPGFTFDPMQSGPAFLFWFLVAGVAYPFVVGGLGGLAASARASPEDGPPGDHHGEGAAPGEPADESPPRGEPVETVEQTGPDVDPDPQDDRPSGQQNQSDEFGG